jgi:NAD(P)-dependent dehydrogenase (short-subunit alcohol dehydrogenase family)
MARVRVAGSVIIVTGAASGIGRATVLTLGAIGAHVVAVDRNGGPLSEVADAAGALAVQADVSQLDHADRVVDAAMAKHGRIDVVVANAGTGYDGAFATMPVERIPTLLDVNLRAPMLLVRAALPHMLEQRSAAAVVFTTSIAGAVPVPNEAAYCVSKTALESFADSLREELRDTQVAVSTVRPGVVRTAFHNARNQPYDRRFPRLIPPEQIATAIAEVVESGAERRTVPSWLEIPAIVRRRAPWLFRTLARRLS